MSTEQNGTIQRPLVWPQDEGRCAGRPAGTCQLQPLPGMAYCPRCARPDEMVEALNQQALRLERVQLQLLDRVAQVNSLQTGVDAMTAVLASHSRHERMRHVWEFIVCVIVVLGLCFTSKFWR